MDWARDYAFAEQVKLGNQLLPGWRSLQPPYQYQFRKDHGEDKPCDCGHFMMKSWEAGYGGQFLPYKKGTVFFLGKDLGGKGCQYTDGMPEVTPKFLESLHNQLGLTLEKFTSDWPKKPDDIRKRINYRVGDVCIVWPTVGSRGHIGIFITDEWIAFHSGRHGSNGIVNFFRHSDWKGRELWVIHTPDIVNGCASPLDFQTSDSTAEYTWEIRHNSKCCWHENLDGEVPWTSNTTPYMCLNWQETRGQTWDTLISPRMNLVGRSSAMLIQACTSNLIHGSNKTIKIKGSTDDGATWTYDIGTDTTQRANIFWADDKRNVRLAWIYVGQVQGGRFWCIDDVGIWAKPSHNKDICVSDIRCPKGRGGITTIITQGKTIKPKAFVWNFGKEDESLSVTYKIGSSYSDTKTFKLYPYNDTLLEFSPWTATPGNYTATCYSNLSGDEFRSNDTATLNFIVAADTWISMFPVYNRGVSTGACITSTGNETLYCVTGKQHFFANYLISQNLWKTRRPTIKNFAGGGCITYANGDYLYALRGGLEKTFYRYRISNNTWTTIANAPDKISNGAAIAYGGGNYIYALRGYRKKSFYRYNLPIVGVP